MNGTTCHRFGPETCLTDSYKGGPFRPAHHLVGVRKRDARYSSRRGPPCTISTKGAHPLRTLQEAITQAVPDMGPDRSGLFFLGNREARLAIPDGLETMGPDLDSSLRPLRLTEEAEVVGGPIKRDRAR